jgi:hypothetical protein
MTSNDNHDDVRLKAIWIEQTLKRTYLLVNLGYVVLRTILKAGHFG